MSWTAVVPVKPSAERKTRLSAFLSAADRRELSELMFSHVISTLSQVPEINRVIVLSSSKIDSHGTDWRADLGRGLNMELESTARAITSPLLVVHADLPELEVADVTAMVTAGSMGIAVAPDRHRSGTNALAASEAKQLVFRFGPNSLSQHCAIAGSRLFYVDRPGLANDVDVLEDLTVLRFNSSENLKIISRIHWMDKT